jgi:hypothetical protein
MTHADRARGLGMATLATTLLFVSTQLTAQTAPPAPGSGMPGFIAPRDDEVAPRLILGPAGQVFRTWHRVGDSKAGGGAVLVATAGPDDTWRTLLEIRPREPGANARDAELATGPAGDLALVYRWRRDNPRAKRLFLARSDDAGKSWTQPAAPIDTSSKAFSHETAWGRDRSLVVVWADERRQSRIFDVYARRSVDGGATWEPEQHLSRFDHQTARDLYARPVMVADGKDRYWVVWVGLRSGRSALYLSRSTDGGRSWTDPRMLSGHESRSVFRQSLQRVGERLLLVWQDARTGRDRIYAVTSSDGGATWSAPARVEHLADSATTEVIGSTSLLGPDGEALVAWHDARNGREDIFVARSVDWGQTWSTEDLRIDADDAGTAVSRAPKLARAADGRIALAWEDDRSGREGIFLRIRDRGPAKAWGKEARLTPPGQKAGRLPDLLFGADGKLYAAWEVWDYSLGQSLVTKSVDGRVLKPTE